MNDYHGANREGAKYALMGTEYKEVVATGDYNICK